MAGMTKNAIIPVILDQKIIFGIGSTGPLLDHLQEPGFTVDLDHGINGIAGLIDHVVPAALLVILHAGRTINADALSLLN